MLSLIALNGDWAALQHRAPQTTPAYKSRRFYTHPLLKTGGDLLAVAPSSPSLPLLAVVMLWPEDVEDNKIFELLQRSQRDHCSTEDAFA
jgi:hypothetical protein